MLIAAYRSLGREFSGIVVKRTISLGITSNQYHLHLFANDGNLSREAIIAVLTDSTQLAKRYGVSAIVYEQAQLYESVSKESFSFFIDVSGEKYLDLGLYWMLLGLAGIVVAVVMHIQTLRTRPGARYMSEDIDVPGLE